MSTRKCSACGHTMGVTHAQYTQCPANAAKNVPASAEVSILTATMNENFVETKESPVSSAFSLFNKKSDETLTAEGAITIVNLTNQLPIEQQEQILKNTYTQLDNREKAKFVSFISGLMKDSATKSNDGYIKYDPTYEKFLVELVEDPNIPRKVLKELRRWPEEEWPSQYPKHVRPARNHGMLGRWRVYGMNKEDRLYKKALSRFIIPSAAVGAGATSIMLIPSGVMPSITGLIAGFVGGTAFGNIISGIVLKKEIKQANADSR